MPRVTGPQQSSRTEIANIMFPEQQNQQQPEEKATWRINTEPYRKLMLVEINPIETMNSQCPSTAEICYGPDSDTRL